MLAVVGAADLDDLVAQSLPAAITENEPLQLPPPLTESQALARLRRLAAENRPGRAMIGLGYHGTVTPAVIRRNVLEDPAWYTAYTPYQPEISQGRLEALLNFQTLIADLTGLPIAGASLLDEATAVAEAMTLARRTHEDRHGPAARRRHPAADASPWSGPGPRPWGWPSRWPGTTCWPPSRRRRPVRRGRPDPWSQRSAGRHRRAPRGRRRGSCQGRRGDRGLRPAGPHRGDPAGGVGGRHRGRFQPALRGAAVLRRPARRLHLRPGEAGALAARPAGRCLPGRATARRRTGSRCRPANSTSGGRRRPPTSAPPRCCWRSPPACTRSTTAPPDWPPIAAAVHGAASALADDLTAGGVEVVHDAFFDTVLARVPGRAADVVRAARESEVHLRLVDADHVGISIGQDATVADLTAVRAAFPVGGDPTASGPSRLGEQRSYVGVPDPSGVQHPPQRDRDAALSAGAVGPRLRARPRA